MKKLIQLLILVFVGIMVLSQCKHEAGEIEVIPIVPIDTSDTNRVEPEINYPEPATNPRVAGSWYYENDIHKLLISKCAMEEWSYTYDLENRKGCHSSEAAMDDIILDNYDDVRFGTAKESGDVVPLIVPFNTDSSFLYKIINDNDMPIHPAADLSPIEKDMIKKWINDGAENTRCYPCDTLAPPTYEAVRKIIYENCGGCHNANMLGQRPANKVSYFNPLNLSQDWADSTKITEDRFRILAMMKHVDDNKLMPKKIGRLYECEVNIIEAWVKNPQ